MTDTMNTARLGDRQKDALTFAYETGWWMPFGRGSDSVLRGLVKRGLMEKRVNHDAYREQSYGVPLYKGVLTEEGYAFVHAFVSRGLEL